MAAAGLRSVVLLSLVVAASHAAQGPPDPATALVVGQVVDASIGRPVSGAVVSLQGSGPRSRPGRSDSVPPRILTGGDGRFVFRDLPAGSYSITASRAGWADGAYGRMRPGGATQPLVLASGSRQGNVVVRMWKFGAITGRVTDEAGEPVVELQVRAFRQVVTGGVRRFGAGTTATTDDRGIYRLGGLVPGAYLVSVVPRQTAVPLSALQQAMPAQANPPPSGFSPQLQGRGFPLRVGDSVVDTGAGGATPPPPSGGRNFTYPLMFYPSAATAAQADAIVVGTGEERSAIDLQIRPVPTVRLAGVVVGPDNVANRVRLRLVPTGASDVALEQDIATAVTDGSGRFEFPMVPEGDYELRGLTAAPPPPGTPSPSPTLWWAALPVHAGREDIVGVTVPLQAGLRISGGVEFDGARAPAGPWQIPLIIEPADGTTFQGPTRGSRVDPSGTFATAGVPAGRYIVRVVGSPVGWMFKSAMYEGRDISIEPLDLRADAAGAILTFTDRWTGVQGLVQDRGGQPDSQATVVVFPASQAAWSNYGQNPRRLRSARTAGDGTYAITSLPPGDYYAAALPDEEASDWQDPQTLAELARSAAHVAITDGAKPTVNLRTRR